MQRIVITGPESSGKTTLAKKLVEEFNALYVPEYARSYLDLKGTNYELSDIINIAIGQLALAESIEASSCEQPFMIIDTWMLELRTWAEYKYGVIPEMLETMYREQIPDFYVLCTPDLVWENDPLRENPYDRELLFEIYLSAIIESKVPHDIIIGTGEERERQASKSVINWLANRRGAR